MFERYRDEARKVIFFAYREARQTNSACIEPEHLLLGLTHEARSKINKLFRLTARADSFRAQLEVRPQPKQPSMSVDLPLSNSSKRVLAYTAEEAERLASQPIGTEHLLLGLLREKDSRAAAMLAQAGIDLASARNRIRQDLGLFAVERDPELHTYRERPTRKSLRPWAASLLLVVVLILIYLIIQLMNSR